MLSKHFEMEDMGVPKLFLGMTIKYHRKYHIKISMEDNINRITSNFKIQESETNLETLLAKGFDGDDNNSPLLDANGKHV